MWPRCAFTNMPSAMQNRNTVVSRFGVSVSNFMVYFIGFILMCLIVSLHFLSLPFSSLFCVHLCFTCSFEICTFKSVFFPHSLSVYLFCSPCHCLRASCFLPFCFCYPPCVHRPSSRFIFSFLIRLPHPSAFVSFVACFLLSAFGFCGIRFMLIKLAFCYVLRPAYLLQKTLILLNSVYTNNVFNACVHV